MLCFSIARNNQALCLMGAEKAESLQVSVVMSPEHGDTPVLVTHGVVRESPEHTALVRWLDESLKLGVGDSVRIELVESEAPDRGTEFGGLGRKASATGVEHFCSWCAKSERSVRYLVPGPNTAICNECVQLCNEIIEEKSGAA